MSDATKQTVVLSALIAIFVFVVLASIGVLILFEINTRWQLNTFKEQVKNNTQQIKRIDAHK